MQTRRKLKPITDDIVWTRELTPRQTYEIAYVDRHGVTSLRILDVLRLGHIPIGVNGQTDYLGVIQQGKFKTLRTDGIRSVRQISEGHDSVLDAFVPPQYSDELPTFPIPNALYKVATIALSNRRYTVDLNRYTCTCPEVRRRQPAGYRAGQLGFVCPHMARAIVEHLPENAGWPPKLVNFLADPRKVHIDNLC